MDNSININQIVSQIEKLDYNDKINVISRIVNLLKREEKVHETSSVTMLKGLGKNIWQNTNIASYVAEERGSWD